MRSRSWIMTQEWHDVLFLHWPVSPDELSPYISSELELDLYNGKAWIGFIFFKVKGNRPRLIPHIPGVDSFLELNIRTYVTYKGKAGVHFFSLDANNPLIVKLTTIKNFLPYRHAKIRLKRSKNIFKIQSRTKHTLSETLVATFEPIPEFLAGNDFDRWLTERYYLWPKMDDHLFEIEISHSPWILQNVLVTVLENTMVPFLKSDYQLNHPIAHYSKYKKALFYFPVMEK